MICLFGVGLVFENLRRLLRGCSSFALILFFITLLTSCSALVCMFGINDPWSSSAVFSLLSDCFSPEIDVNTAGLRQHNCYLGQKLWNLQGKLVRAAFFFHHHSSSVFCLMLPPSVSVLSFFLELFSLLRCLFPLFISSPLVFLSPGEVCIGAGLRARTVPIRHVNKKDGWKHSGSCSGTFLLTALCYHHRRQVFFVKGTLDL